MFSGIQEIVIIVLIVLGIFLVPRMIPPRSSPNTIIVRRPALRISWPLRLAIVLSVLWPAAWGLYFKPWQQNALIFVIVGIGPVVVAWSLKWVLAGMKNNR